MLAFLSTRALAGVEHVTESSYARTMSLNGVAGWITVTQSPNAPALIVECSPSLTPQWPALLAEIRSVFDLDARPDLIAAHLGLDPQLSASVAANPGLRVPGAFSGFELSLRAILGQQVSVKAARTIACRLVETFGVPVATPFPELHRLSPTAARMAQASVDDIARHGIVSARAKSIIALAAALESGALSLDDAARADPAAAIARRGELPGIGPWTAHYIAMRALRWSDAFPKEDIVVRNNLGRISAKEAERQSQAWRPWRSYALMHVWRMEPPL